MGGRNAESAGRTICRVKKGLIMFVSQGLSGGSIRQQGRCRADLAELRHRLAGPSQLDNGHRLRLLELANRLECVQELGDDFARLELSEHVTAAMERGVATV